jgi:hypothetical protein
MLKTSYKGLLMRKAPTSLARAAGLRMAALI